MIEDGRRRFKGIAIPAEFRQEGKPNVREIEVVPLDQADNADGRRLIRQADRPIVYGRIFIDLIDIRIRFRFAADVPVADEFEPARCVEQLVDKRGMIQDKCGES